MGEDEGAEEDGEGEVPAVGGAVEEGRLGKAAGFEGAEVAGDGDVAVCIGVEWHF